MVCLGAGLGEFEEVVNWISEKEVVVLCYIFLQLMSLGRIPLDQVKRMENGKPSTGTELMVLPTSKLSQQLQERPEGASKSAEARSPPQSLGDLNLVLGNESSSSDDSDSEDETFSPPEPVALDATRNQPEKRRRSQPVKFEPSPIGRKKLHLTRHTPKSVPNKNYSAGKLRGTRCGRCEGCKRDDCAKCVFCKDKPKFGGPGKKKQRCKMRICTNFQHRTGGGKVCLG